MKSHLNQFKVTEGVSAENTNEEEDLWHRASTGTWANVLHNSTDKTISISTKYQVNACTAKSNSGTASGSTQLRGKYENDFIYHNDEYETEYHHCARNIELPEYQLRSP